MSPFTYSHIPYIAVSKKYTFQKATGTLRLVSITTIYTNNDGREHNKIKTDRLGCTYTIRSALEPTTRSGGRCHCEILKRGTKIKVTNGCPMLTRKKRQDHHCIDECWSQLRNISKCTFICCHIYFIWSCIEMIMRVVWLPNNFKAKVCS
jgi:hypothetical protein